MKLDGSCQRPRQRPAGSRVGEFHAKELAPVAGFASNSVENGYFTHHQRRAHHENHPALEFMQEPFGHLDAPVLHRDPDDADPMLFISTVMGMLDKNSATLFHSAPL